MDTFLSPGRLFLAVAMVLFGIQQLVGASFSIAVPGHPWAVEQPLWSLLIGTMFAVAGIGMLTRSRARLAATVLIFRLVHFPPSDHEDLLIGWLRSGTLRERSRFLPQS